MLNISYQVLELLYYLVLQKFRSIAVANRPKNSKFLRLKKKTYPPAPYAELRPLGFSFDESLVSGGPLSQQIQSEGYHLGLVRFLLRSLADLYPDLPVGAFSSNAVFTVKDKVRTGLQ